MAHPRDVRIAELQAQMEAAKAEIAQLKADEQVEIAEDKALNFKAAAENKKTAIDLEGNRDSEGNLITGTAMNISGAEVVGVDDDEQEPLTITDVTDDRPMNISGVDVEDDTTKTADADYPLSEEGFKLIQEDKKRKHNISGVELPLEEEEEEASKEEHKPAGDKSHLVERQRSERDIEEDVEEEVEDEPEYGEAAPEEEPEKDTDGRRKATEIENLRGEKAGWEMKEGANFWSVNEKDPYWKTEEGYEEAVNLYGDKPSWLKAQDVGTLVYNPSTGEYEEVEQEEFVDLSPKKRPSL